MIIHVRVIPGAKKAQIKRIDQGYKVYLNAPAVAGKANKALIVALAEHFQVKRAQIEITKGLKSQDKTINIEDL